MSDLHAHKLELSPGPERERGLTSFSLTVVNGWTVGSRSQDQNQEQDIELREGGELRSQE